MLNVHFCKQEILYWINKALNESSLICIKLTPRSSKNCKEFQRFLKHSKLFLSKSALPFQMLILVINVEFLRIIKFLRCTFNLQILKYANCLVIIPNILFRHKMIVEGITFMLFLFLTYWKMEWKYFRHGLKQDLTVKAFVHLLWVIWYLFILTFYFCCVLYTSTAN